MACTVSSCKSRSWNCTDCLSGSCRKLCTAAKAAVFDPPPKVPPSPPSGPPSFDLSLARDFFRLRLSCSPVDPTHLPHSSQLIIYNNTT
eukprot:1175997-Prorocentrum_minimum.AAC.7